MRFSFLLLLSLCTLIFISADAQDPTLNWAFSLNGSAGGSATVKKIVKDANGYTYITGSFAGSVDFDPGAGTVTKTSLGNSDIFLAKYDGTGNYVWAFSMGTLQIDVGNSLKLDGSGNIYIIGQFGNGSPSIDFDPSATTYNLNIGGATHTFLAKYDGSGNFLWVKGFGASGPTDIGYDLALDASGNIFMIGTTSSASPGVDYDPGSGTVNLITNGAADIVLAKYDASGNYIWAKNIGSTTADVPNSVALDGSGNVYITGYFNGTADFDPSASTNALTSAGGTDIFIAKYDGSGNYLWANRIGSSGADIGYGLALDGSGNVHITGGFNGTVDFDPGSSTSNLVTSSGVYTDIFLAKYDGSGNYIWAKSMGGVNYDYGYGLVLDGSGNIYTTGAFYRDLLCSGCITTADFDPGAGTANLTSQGLYDIFIGKYDASGNYVWAKAFGGTSNDAGYSLTLDASGTLLVAGVFGGTIDFDPGSGTSNLTSTGAQDIVIASYAAASASNTAGAASSTPTLCINTTLTNITHSTTGATGIGTATGLPAGVIASWSSNTITISGTPTAAGTFNYSIPLTGGSGSISATGTITVTAANTAGAASSSPSVCINSALTNITHGTTGATGIGTATGLPAGVSASWSSNTITISGTPTASGTFNYSIPLAGGCGTVNATGTIIVGATAPTVTLSASSTTICAGSPATLTASGATTYVWSPSTGLSSTTGASVIASPTTATTYTVIGTTDGCSSSGVSGSSSSFSSVSFGTAHVLAVKSNGTLWGWGNNFYNEMGNGSTTDINTPTQIGTNTNWSKVAASGDHSHAITSDGKLWGWGRRINGRVGDGSNSGTQTTPVQIGSFTNWGSIYGSHNTNAIKTDGTAWVWGWGQNGQLGVGNNTTVNTSPQQMGSDTWTKLAGAYGFALGIKTGGTLWSWGSNSNGWLGLGNNTDRNTPAQVGSSSNWTDIITNNNATHVFGLKSDGTVWAWGTNANYQLGDGTNTNRNAPVQILSGSTWKSIAAGYNFSLAVKSDGTLWAWGYNANGAVGDGTTTQRISPVQIGSSTDWATVNTTQQSSFAFKTDGTLWGWGLNGDSQLGDGTTTTRLSPVPLSISLATTGISITVTTAITASAASSSPTLYVSTTLTNITHTTTGATGIGTATGLPSGVTAAWSSNTITISGTPTVGGTFNYSIPLTGGCGNVNATGTIIVVSTYTWSSPGVNSLWSNANNWSTGTVPPAGVEVLISSGSVQMDLDYSVGGRLTLSGTGTLTINAGKTLSIASGGVADFGGKLVTFKSDATGTGQLGTVAGTLSNATNVLVERHIPAGRRAFRFFGSPVTTTNNTTNKTIKDNWMENATPGVLAGYPYSTTSVYNPKPGYGTLITGAGGNTNGFDESQTSNPSLFTFNNSTGAWVTSTNTSATISAGSAYRLFVRGDRSYGITAKSEPPGGSTILRTSGTMVQGELTTGTHLPALSQAASGWSLVGNPYQSVVDMASADVVKNNLTPYYYIWDPKMATRGAYVSYNLNILSKGSNYPTSEVNRYVQPGQAFFVQNSTTAGSNSIVFKETAKGAAINQTATFARNNTRAGAENGYTIDATTEKAEIVQTLAANYASLSAILYYTDSLAVGAAATDATRAIFGSLFSNIVDGNDGRKFTNLDETMSIKQGTSLLSMELRGLPDTSTIIPLNITQYVDKKYTMRLLWDEKLGSDTLIAYLRDKYTNKETEVKKTGNTDVEYILDADAKSSAADRFEIIFKRTSNQVTAVINYDNGQYIKIYPNPVQSMLNIDFDLGQSRQVDIKVYDMTGRLVMERKATRTGTTINLISLAKGTYNVQVWGSDAKLMMSEKIIKD